MKNLYARRRREKGESVLDCFTWEVGEETGLAVESVDQYLGHLDYINARGRASHQLGLTPIPTKPDLIVLTEHDRHQWIRDAGELPPITAEFRAFLTMHRPRG